MNKTGIGTFRVAATYIGTVVGAGFASGQEVLQFFSHFGAWGAMGLVLVTVLFIYFGIVIMDIGRGFGARSHLEVIRHSGGRVLGGIVDVIISFFLFGSLTTMIAGTGALFTQQFHLPGLLGCSLMAIVTAITVLTGIRGVINSISFVVPFLLVAVVATCVFAMMNTPPNFYAAMPAASNGIITNWFMAAVLYVSYNTLVSVAVLGPLGVHAKNKKTIGRGALLGGIGLGAAAFLIYLALSVNLSVLSKVEVPMLYLAGGASGILQLVYAVVLAAEIYTTAVGSLYGFAARFTNAKKSPMQGNVIIVI
ncbi:MAG: hypothetical protein WCP73_09275, partial [Eubacteriales bacterium]